MTCHIVAPPTRAGGGIPHRSRPASLRSLLRRKFTTHCHLCFSFLVNCVVRNFLRFEQTFVAIFMTSMYCMERTRTNPPAA
jgi:hypothetical protein